MLLLVVLSLLPLTRLAVSTLPPRQYFIREPDNQTAIQGEQVKITLAIHTSTVLLQNGAFCNGCITIQILLLQVHSLPRKTNIIQIMTKSITFLLLLSEREV
jgi:hypothetical protein